MEVSRDAEDGAMVYLTHDEVRELLGAFALSIAAYGILQNFMSQEQKVWAMPSIGFISRLGALLAANEEFDTPT